MRNSNELFDLIRSLTKSEKRYFKLFTSLRGGEKKYLLLFDAIDAQAGYDEAAIREQFSNQKFVRQLNVAKKYLYDLILKSLRVYHAESTYGARIREMVRTIEVLYNKGLEVQAEKVLHKAMKLAGDAEDFTQMLELHDWRHRLNSRMMDSDETVSQFFAGKLCMVDQLRNWTEYSMHLCRIGLPISRGTPRSAAELQRLDEILHEPLLRDASNALSVRARSMYMCAHAAYHFSYDHFHEAIHYSEQQIALLEQHPAIIEAQPLHYLMMLNNSIGLRLSAGDKEGFHECQERFRTRAKMLMADSTLRKEHILDAVFYQAYSNLLMFYISTGAFAQADALAAEVEQWLESHEGSPIGNESYVYRQLMRAAFGVGDYRRALRYCLKVLAAGDSGPDMPAYSAGRLMQIIIHFELGNHRVVESLVLSTYRYLRSRELNYQVEHAVLAFFRTLPGIDTNAQLLAAFDDLRHRIIECGERDPLERNALKFFHYVEWLQSRIEGRDFGEIVREGVPFPV